MRVVQPRRVRTVRVQHARPNSARSRVVGKLQPHKPHGGMGSRGGGLPPSQRLGAALQHGEKVKWNR